MAEIKNIQPLQEEKIQELEKFADILVSPVIILRESELEPGSLLFSLVVEKLRGPCCRDISAGLLRVIDGNHFKPFVIKATESTEGLGAKGKQREDGRRKNSAFNTLRVRGHPQFQQKCNFCESRIMGVPTVKRRKC